MLKISSTITIEKPLPSQYEFWLSPQRHRAYIGGIGSGKTLAGCVEILRQRAGTRGTVVAPTYPMLRDSTQFTFFELFRDAIESHNVQENITQLKNGSIILWRSADRPDSLRGANLDWWYGDEAEYFSEQTWDVMLGRIRKKGARSWITSSPNGDQSWVVKRIEQKAAEKPDVYKVVHATTMDNIHLPKEYVEDLIESYTTEHARQELYGERVSLSGMLWSRQWVKRGVVPDGQHEYVLGVDLAISADKKSDDRAIVVMCKVENTFYVVEYAVGKWGFYETKERIADIATRYNASCIAVENVAYQQAMVESLQRETMFYIKAVSPRGQNKKTRFFPMAGKYEHGYIVHNAHTDMKQLEDELANFDGSGKYPDNIIDAEMYAMEACDASKVEMFLL